MKRIALWLLPPTLLMAAAAAWWLIDGRGQDVTLAPVRVGDAVELVYATGFVEAEHPVTVAARLTAPVRAVLVEEGAAVRHGQPLILLDDEEQRHGLQQATAQRRAALQDERRTLTLFAKGWVTRAARDSAVATADSAKAAAQIAEARLNQMVVRSGMDGIILRRDVEPGDLAVPSRALMILGDPGRIRITATVDERDVPRIHPGQPALMSTDAWPGRVLHGHVREITPAGDPDQRAFRARIVTDAAMRLPIGLTLEVNIITRHARRQLLVPRDAVGNGQVWIVRNGRAHARPVRAGIAGTSEVQILSGLSQGEKVVTKPDGKLSENMRVRVTQ